MNSNSHLVPVVVVDTFTVIGGSPFGPKLRVPGLKQQFGPTGAVNVEKVTVDDSTGVGVAFISK